MDAQVLIVGAGPAGAALALRLARLGRDVLILESSRFPRDKPCGDCLNPGALGELGRLGVAETFFDQLRPVALRGWRIEAPDGACFKATFGRGGNGLAAGGWAIRRRDLDRALLAAAERAGARVESGIRVFDVMQAGGRVSGVMARCGARVEQRRAGVVVGADGLRSVLRERLGLRARRPRLRKIALVGHLADLWSNDVGNGGDAYGELTVRAGRVCGYAPLGAGANVTLVVPASEARGIAGDAHTFLLSGLGAFPAVSKRLRRAVLEPRVMVTGPFDHPVRRPWAPGALLVGDAAGYYDPFTGQGIYQALRTADLAAATIDQLLGDPRAERALLRRYGRQLRYEFAPKRAVQRSIETVISRPRAMSRFVRALSGDDNAPAQQLLRVTGDLEHPVTLLDPRLWVELWTGWRGEPR